MKLGADVLLCFLFPDWERTGSGLGGGCPVRGHRVWGSESSVQALARPVSSEVLIFSGAEGAAGSMNCHPTSTGNRKFFCRNSCAAADVLIQSDAESAQRGRFSLSYRPEASSTGTLTVAITGLTAADSGRYRCGLGSAQAPESYQDFDIRVSDDPFLDRNSGLVRTDFEGEDITFFCSGIVYGRQKFFCKDECKDEEDVLVETEENKAWRGRFVLEYTEASGFTVTIRRAAAADTGRYRCGFGRALAPSWYIPFPILVVKERRPKLDSSPPGVSSGPGLLLPVALSVCVVLLLVAVLLVFLHKRKTSSRNVRRTADDVHMEASVTYENCPSGSSPEASSYLSLDPASRDQDQVYSTV